MTTNASAAWTAIKARLTAARSSGDVTVPLYWQNETTGEPLPDDEPFAFVSFAVFPQYPASFGAGRGFTRMRTPAALTMFLCLPKGWGLEEGFTRAEELAAVFRNKRFDGISCFGVTPDPAGLLRGDHAELAGNFDVIQIDVDLRFDQLA